MMLICQNFLQKLNSLPSGKRLHNYGKSENHHAINGKIHYFYGHFPVRKLLVYHNTFRQLMSPSPSSLQSVGQATSGAKPQAPCTAG